MVETLLWLAEMLSSKEKCDIVHRQTDKGFPSENILWIFWRWGLGVAGDVCLEKITPICLSARGVISTNSPPSGPQKPTWRNPELLTGYSQRAAEVGKHEALIKSSHPLQLRCCRCSLTMGPSYGVKEDETLTRGRWGVQEKGMCCRWVPAGYCWHGGAQGKSAWLHDTRPDTLSGFYTGTCLQKPCRHALISPTEVSISGTCLCSLIQGYRDTTGKPYPLVGRTWLRPTLAPLHYLWHLQKLA